MIDEEITHIARERAQLEIEEQGSRLKEEIESIKEEMNERGMFRSGMTLKRITDLCADTIKNRAQLVWQIYFRFLTTAGISYCGTLSKELKDLVSYHLPEKLGDLKRYLTQYAGLIGSPDRIDKLILELDSARKSALAKIGTEIDLFVRALQRKEEIKDKGDPSKIFNIYSSVGSIQTGDYAISNVTFTIDADDRKALTQALNQISEMLNNSSVILSQPKADIVKLVHEGQQELKKTNPNITKLRSLLSAVGGLIQTVASMKPAYDTLKQALKFLGISLP